MSIESSALLCGEKHASELPRLGLKLEYQQSRDTTSTSISYSRIQYFLVEISCLVLWLVPTLYDVTRQNNIRVYCIVFRGSAMFVRSITPGFNVAVEAA